MARPKPPGYDTEGFTKAHQARGLDASATEFLKSKGALPKQAETQGKSPSRKTSVRPSATKGEAEADAADGEGAAESSPKAPGAKSKSGRSSRKKTTDAAPQGHAELEDQLPRRSRKARSLKALHFRLPLDIDAKLRDLVAYYEGTMVWVICKIIQEDWVRTRRAQRREQPVPSEEGRSDVQAESREDPSE